VAGYKSNFQVGWSGPHQGIPANAKNKAIAGVTRLASEMTVSRAGIVQFGQRAHAWFVRNRQPFMNHPQVTIGTLHFTLHQGSLQIAEINVATGEVLYIIDSLR
jgi:hypothetical protein